ncbi:MAG: alkyl hydroperoxide reductase, partial [Planctomycetota bacterium]
LTQALPLNGVEQLEFVATFDNSPQNPVNPDPSQLVVWGDQTWEEMAVVFLVVSEPRDAGDVTDAEGDTSLKTSDAPPPEPEVEYSADVRQQMAAEADRILARFDTNQDGTVTRRETPFAFRFGFSAIDANSDGKLSRQEIEEAAAERMR